MKSKILSPKSTFRVFHTQWSFKRRELSRSTLQTEDMPPTLHHFLHLLLFILLLFLLLLLLLFHFSILG
jgi:hypothetical protein